MSAPKTIFDTVTDDFLRALESDPEVPDSVPERLRQLIDARNLKPESIRGAIINDETES